MSTWQVWSVIGVNIAALVLLTGWVRHNRVRGRKDARGQAEAVAEGSTTGQQDVGAGFDLARASAALDAELQHSGSKYHRIACTLNEMPDGVVPIMDVYCVLVTFETGCPALDHALKKLLCAGIRGKGGWEQDVSEARDALTTAIKLQKFRDKRKRIQEGGNG